MINIEQLKMEIRMMFSDDCFRCADCKAQRKRTSKNT